MLESRLLLASDLVSLTPVPGNSPLTDLTIGAAAADLNGDGRDDLVTTNYTQQAGSSVSVVLNAGTMGKFAAPVNYPLGHRPDVPVIADFDGDGRPDVAVAYMAAGTLVGTVAVFHNTGDGTLAGPVLFTGLTRASIPVVTAADFDGDGRVDLAVRDGPLISLMHNTGGGTFAAPAGAYQAGGYAYALATGDVDRDGWTDLLVPNYGENTVSVLRNRGDGTFAAPVAYAAGTGPQSVAAADLDGDGWIDLAVSGEEISSKVGGLRVLRNKRNGTFAARVNYDTDSYSTQTVKAVDLNFDGRPELVFGAANEFGLFGVAPNLGNGTFAATEPYEPVTNAQMVVAVGDFDGDSWPDVALAGRAGPTTIARVFRNTYDFPPRAIPATLIPGVSVIRLSFSEDVYYTSASDLTLTPLAADGTPGTPFQASDVWFDQFVNHTASFTFAKPLPDGRYRVTLHAPHLTDISGQPLVGDVSRDVLIFGGDANGDRVVNFDDLLVLAKNYNKFGAVWSQGDFTGDRVVNFDDLLVLAKNYNKTFPAATSWPSTAAAMDVESLAAAMGIAVPASAVTKTQPPTTPPSQPPAPAKKPVAAPRPPTPAKPVPQRPVKPAAGPSVVRDRADEDDKAEPVFSTTRVVKPAPAPARPLPAARPKAR